MGKRHVTPSEKEYIVNNAKLGVSKIANNLNLHYGTVYNWANKLGVNVGRRKDEQLNKALRMFDEGLSCRDVMKALKRSQSTVDRWYSVFLHRTKRKEVLDYYNGDNKQPYWTTESEIEESLNLSYSAEDLTGEEKAIFLGKVSMCKI